MKLSKQLKFQSHIAEEAKSQPDLLHNTPITTKFGRMDEVKAARELV